MTDPRRISIAENFSRYPAGRFEKDGPYSGEAFRNRFLLGPLRRGDDLLIDLDGTAGFGSSFLEEAFGGLVRAGIRKEEVLSHLSLHASDESVADEIREYIRNARG